MALSKIAPNTHADFQTGLMTAIWNTLNTFQSGQIDLEHADNFDQINANSANLESYLVQAPAYQLAVEALQQTDATARSLIQSRYRAPLPPLELLLSLPPDSLGYAYATLLKTTGLKPLDSDPSLFAWERVDADVTYVEYRYQVTHDVWHVVTGFDTSPLGELGLQAFYLAQFRLPSALVALVGGLVGFMVASPEYLPTLMTTIEQGWQMGKTAQQLIAQKWEAGWAKPLTQWQQELGIQLPT